MLIYLNNKWIAKLIDLRGKLDHGFQNLKFMIPLQALNTNHFHASRLLLTIYFCIFS